MRRIILAGLLLSIVIVTTGCARDKGANMSNQTMQRQFEMIPQMELNRTVMQIQRLERSDFPITKEQAEKFIPIIKEIQANSSINEEFATKKINEINVIFTEDQKQFLNQRQNSMAGDRNNDKNGNGISTENQNNPNGQNGNMPDFKNNTGEKGFQNGNKNGAPPTINSQDMFTQLLKTLENRAK